MIFSPEGVVSSEDYEYQIKAVCKMVSNRNHAFGAADSKGLKQRALHVPQTRTKTFHREAFFRIPSTLRKPFEFVCCNTSPNSYHLFQQLD